VRVHLNTDTQVRPCEGEPEVVQPTVVEHEAFVVSLVLGVDSPGNGLGRLPGADPKDLTFALAATTAAEVRECLIEDAARQTVGGRH
jgi:hypothetical protein